MSMPETTKSETTPIQMTDLEKSVRSVFSAIEEKHLTTLWDALSKTEPTISMGEIEGILRKLTLEQMPPGKRTETATPDRPAGGSDLAKEKLPSAEERFKELKKKQGL